MNRKIYTLIYLLFIVIITYFLSGCAATQTWGTYQKKSTVETNLNGNADLYGTIRMAKDLTVATGYSIYNRDQDTYGVITDIRIEPGNINIKSDKSGNFTCKKLKPGNYSIYFVYGKRTKKRTDITLRPDQQLDLTVYVQGRPSTKTPANWTGGIPGFKFTNYYSQGAPKITVKK